jgi:hypothetical protein
LVIAIYYGFIVKNKNIKKNPEYEYFLMGLIARIFGAIFLGLIYFFYYGGGDTINYHRSSIAYAKLIFVDVDDFWTGWFGSVKYNYLAFNEFTGFPTYRPTDSHAFFVVRLLIPIVSLGCYSYFASAILTALVTYGGLWKLYQTFLAEFPHLRREMAIACLFIPSCVFWGSGLMKDSFTISAVGWYTYSFYNLFIKRNWKVKYFLFLFISSFVIIAIKPYIFFALLPGSILWMSSSTIKKIYNPYLRALASPVLLIIAGIAGFFALSQIGDSLGVYKVDTVLDRAVIVQQDMKADYYGGNSFDIGDFDASVSGITSKAPTAIFAGIFRPGLWDVRNPVMLVSALENTYLLLLTFFLLYKLKFLGFFRYINKNSMILFSVMFSLFFAFSVGLTCANFGSLVRLRIPELPFFVASLFAIRYHYEKTVEKRQSKKIKKKKINLLLNKPSLEAISNSKQTQ